MTAPTIDDDSRSVIIISRDGTFAAPRPVRVDIRRDGMAVSMTLEDFLDEVTTAYGNPTLTVSQAQHRERLGTAAATVLAALQTESVRLP